MIAVLFERGAFGVAESDATAGALVAYAAGLPAFVLIKVLVPGYFARQDTRTPVRIAILCLVVNVALNLALMGPLAHVGIALATTLAGWLNVGLLAALALEMSLETAGLRIAALAALVAAGLVAYGALVIVTGVVSVSEMRTVLARRQDRKQGQDQGQG